MNTLAASVLDYLLDEDQPLIKKRAVLRWYTPNTSCNAIQALLDTIPPDDPHRRLAFWFVFDELITPTRQRQRRQVLQ